MKILIGDKNKVIYVHTDFKNIDEGLIGQTIAELEIIKQQLLDIYMEEEGANR